MKIQTYQQLYAYCQEQKDALIEALTEAIGLALLLDDGYQRQFCVTINMETGEISTVEWVKGNRSISTNRFQFAWVSANDAVNMNNWVYEDIGKMDAATFDDLDPALQKEVISKYLFETCDYDDRIRYAPNAVYEETMKWLEKESKVRDKINKGFERKE